MFSKVNPKEILLKLGTYTKLPTIYYGPLEILDRIIPIAYMISFPTSKKIHNVLNVSFLKKYLSVNLIILNVGN